VPRAYSNKKLAYITDLASTPNGGGSYAVNWHVQVQLRKHFELYTPRPLTPRVSPRERFLSRAQRYLLKRPGKFFYFSPSTLDDNARRASSCFRGDVDGVFFRSATRWCHCRPKVPYFVYLDAVFHTFFENTFNPKDFQKEDLQRIFRAEARFLEGASAVFFESAWGLQKAREAREAYGLKGDHYFVAHRGGVIEPPGEVLWSDDPPFLLSVAMNFEQKGGDIILEAFKRLKEVFPDLRWHIVGGRPTGDWKSVDGIVYEGVLNPDEPGDKVRFRQLLSKAFLLVHPTREDTSPLVITDAAYFGCPTISVNRFAIPELIRHGETGMLVNWPIKADDLAEGIRNLINSSDLYRRLRRGAFQHSRTHFSWAAIGDEIARRIEEVLV
jgi:glycosyltransferase involved in cell wall biosynthesis